MINKILKTTILSILIIFPVITVHELGHLIGGMALGLNPESFSLGFGPMLYEFKAIDINWQLRSIPLGGFVEFPRDIEMLVSYKYLIALILGPLSNFLMGFLCYWYFYRKVNDNSYIYFNGRDYVIDLSYFKLGLFHYHIEDDSIYEYENILNKNEWTLLKKTTPLDMATMIFLPFKRKTIQAKLLLQSFESDYEHPYKVMSPIGIVKNGMSEWDYHKLSFVSFMGGLSIGIGFLNLLPIPIFDGGKFFLILSHMFNLSLIKIGLGFAFIFIIGSLIKSHFYRK